MNKMGVDNSVLSSIQCVRARNNYKVICSRNFTRIKFDSTRFGNGIVRTLTWVSVCFLSTCHPWRGEGFVCPDDASSSFLRGFMWLRGKQGQR